MMKKIITLLILLASPLLFAASETAQLDTGLVNPGYHDKPEWFKESFLDISEDIEGATDAGKRVMLYFYQDGCPYCAKLLHDNFGNRDIADKTQKYFDVIAINMWGDREVSGLDGEATTEKAFSQSLKVQFTPTLLFLDESGKVLVRLNGYLHPHQFDVVLDYVAQRKEGQMSVRDYVASINPQAASGKLHMEPGFIQSPVNLAALDKEKPVLLLLKQKTCAACDELHQDILQRKAVRKSLEQLQVVLLDIWSEEKITGFDGVETTSRKLAEQLGVHYAPSMLYFVAGKEAFRTEGYLRAFHVHGGMDYVLGDAYIEQPEFQRYLQDRRAEFEARGIHVDLWE